MNDTYDVMIIGAGAAGLTAGIYASRARLSTLILNDGAIGGQMVLTNEVANYPGVETTNGYVLANTMKKQAKSFGCKIKSNAKIARYHLEGDMKSVELEDGRTFSAKTVILTPGGRPRSLGIPGEDTFKGTGISYCATCDGDFFKDKEIAVIGGGNSALEEAVTLTSFASKVTIVHQFDHFQAFEHAVEEARKNPKIEFVMESEPREFSGNGSLQTLTVEHLPTGEKKNIAVDGTFIFIGYLPNTEPFKGLVELNERNEFVVDREMKTNIPGVFAAGDCINKRYRQITTATAEGTVAALSASEYLRQM
ncbi:thioredoxin-disulfide reductase [Marinilabilia salmonicolor]|jgi:thioredoxin reductase (NADPH)|uniref:Thioredoxin reductase n=1 Tax=Marinilabilia salmonicolor TaxID=989 RepID=A0A2T0XII3_9BACT|nr:thioredoxin-disulfide reductase [Marinilabilia salmonicolor]PRY98774.1 thioredoxin reductase (NADPH) [Marinilabilia salmonicolor]RCW38965.1 thioredoxin reductase (NADPH) [Marinilabilia salmonicolor]